MVKDSKLQEQVRDRAGGKGDKKNFQEQTEKEMRQTQEKGCKQESCQAMDFSRVGMERIGKG